MATSWSPRTTYRIRQLPDHLQDRHQAIALLIRLEESLGPLDNIFMSPLASSANLWERIPSKTTTVRFKRLPTVLANTKNRWILSARDAGYAQNVVIDIHFLEFTVFNDIAPETHTCDCIAISGLSGHAFGSWRCKDDDSDFMWLRDGLPHDVPVMRSMTYGYDTSLLLSTSVQTIEDIARMFIRKLKSEGRSSPSTKPLIFLAHSLGGIILKRALVIMANSGDAETFILKSVRAVVFFGAPSHGMYMSHLLPMVEGQPNETLVRFLAPGSTYLADLDEQFNGIARLQHIRVVSVYETGLSRTTENVDGQWKRTGPLELLVSPESAISRVSIEADQLPINEDHSNMVKFSEDDVNYRGVILYLLDICSSLENTSNPEDALSKNRTISAISMKQTHVTRREVDESQSRLFNELMRSLEVEESGRRFREIAPHYQDTFSWIYEDTDVAFEDWLLHGSGIFWINGKPGSGKSTLMKYIVQSQRTYDILHKRKCHGKQITVDFFFHNRGTHLQKSLEGLYRDILHQILSELPEIQEIALTNYQKRHDARKISWDLTELEQIFQALLQQTSVPVSVILFLDALDEYDGPAERIAQFIKLSLVETSKSATKFQICFSSRPWNHFIDEFGSSPGFQIHDHTKDDIRSYVSASLGADQVVSRLTTKNNTFGTGENWNLIEAIVEKAQGVFLWVKLTIDEIRQAAANGSSLAELLDILSNLPDQLEDHYIRTIDRVSIRKDVRLECYAIFEIVLRSGGNIRLVDLATAVACSTCTTASQCASRIPSDSEATEIEDQFSRRLKHRCGGLVEVIDGITGRVVQFMHQTVKDFVSKPEFQEYVFGRGRRPIVENGFTFLSKYTLAYLTTGRIRTGNIYAFSGMAIPDECVIYALLSESTTGTSQKSFLDSMDDSPFRIGYNTFFTKAEILPIEVRLGRLGRTDLPVNSRLSFAVVADLRLYIQETLQRRPLVNMNPDKSLLHCVVETSTSGNPSKLSDLNRSPSDMTRMLLEYGADAGVLFNELTPFQFLFYDFRKDEDSYGYVSAEFLEMARVFLSHGQKADCSIIIANETGTRNYGSTPLHVANTALALLLIDYGADVNALDESGRTALDISYISAKHWFREHPEEAYEKTMVLITNGGRVTEAIDGFAPGEWTNHRERFLHIVEEYYTIDPRMRNPKRLGDA